MVIFTMVGLLAHGANRAVLVVLGEVLVAEPSALRACRRAALRSVVRPLALGALEAGRVDARDVQPLVILLPLITVECAEVAFAV